MNGHVRQYKCVQELFVDLLVFAFSYLSNTIESSKWPVGVPRPRRYNSLLVYNIDYLVFRYL